MTAIETVRKGKRVGVSRDGKAVGYAVLVNRKSEPEAWTAYVNIAQPPFDLCRPGFTSEAAVVAFIAKHGVAR